LAIFEPRSVQKSAHNDLIRELPYPVIYL